MADIFISYAKEDRSRVAPLAKALADHDLSVWWDRTISAGKSWPEVLCEALESARSVIVVWSKISVKSRWVREEAEWGLERNILIPILIDEVRPPLGFGTIQAADLTSWNPAQFSPDFEKLIADISIILAHSPKHVKEAERAAEEELKRKQEEERKKADEKRRFEEEQKRAEAELKDEEERNGKLRIKNNFLKISAVLVIILIMVAGIWWLISESEKDKMRISESEKEKFRIETNRKLSEIIDVIKNLEQNVVKCESLDLLDAFYKQKTDLDNEIKQAEHRASIAGISQQAEKARKRLEEFSSLLSKQKQKIEEAEKIAKIKTPIMETKPGKIFVDAWPENATIKILNPEQLFHQGKELEAGTYQVQVSLQGYETEDRWIELNSNEEKRIQFDLKKIVPKAGRLIVEVIPDNAAVRILGNQEKINQEMDLKPGRYNLEASLDGYETQQQVVDIGPGEEKRINFRLAKLPPKAGWLFMEFVLIPAGSFTMGSIAYEREKPPHKVKISQPFYLQTTEVSQGQWKKVMGENPSKFAQCGDDCPVEHVSWDDVKEFIKRLNAMERTSKYRLPSEAEWEYACRAGTNSEYSFGDDFNRLSEYAWYKGNARGTTHPVGKKKPNPQGLYDMHGNVWEWVEDDWHDNFHVAGAPADSSSWVDNPRGNYRVARGGGWDFEASICRSGARESVQTNLRNFFVGFRLAKSP